MSLYLLSSNLSFQFFYSIRLIKIDFILIIDQILDYKMIGVTSDSYDSYMNFVKGYWFDNKVVDCGSIECNTTHDYSIEEIKKRYVTPSEKLNNLYLSNHTDQEEKQSYPSNKKYNSSSSYHSSNKKQYHHNSNKSNNKSTSHKPKKYILDNSFSNRLIISTIN